MVFCLRTSGLHVLELGSKNTLNQTEMFLKTSLKREQGPEEGEGEAVRPPGCFSLFLLPEAFFLFLLAGKVVKGCVPDGEDSSGHSTCNTVLFPLICGQT